MKLLHFFLNSFYPFLAKNTKALSQIHLGTMLVEMFYASTFWLNCFPPSSGASKTMSPRLLVTGVGADYTKHCALEFGSYMQVHKDHNNTLVTQTYGAIALQPAGNLQGGHYFMSLATGWCMAHNHWTELPMPNKVIQRVNHLGRQQNMQHGLEFLNCLQEPFEGDDQHDKDQPDMHELNVSDPDMEQLDMEAVDKNEDHTANPAMVDQVNGLLFNNDLEEHPNVNKYINK